MNLCKFSTLLRLGLCFLLTAALLLGILLLSTLVPRSAIEPQMRQSAEYLCEGELFGEAVKGVPSSRIDRYADSILLGIAWQLDSGDALRSVMETAYYHQPWQNENDNLREALEKDLPANQQYLRYWHGSAGVVRALMVLLTLPQIYLFHGILLGTLLLALLARLAARREWTLLTGLLAGCVGCAVWFVPLSLEYTWVFLILLIQLHLVITPAFPRSAGKRCAFFLVSGMVTNYLDFLTCETLTLLVPLLALVWLDRKRGEGNAPWRALAKTAAVWLAGYAGMFLLKWLLAALVLRENVLPYVAGHIEERTVGSVGVGFLQEWLAAPLRNLSNLFPVDYFAAGPLFGMALLLGAAYAGYVYHREGFDKGLLARLAALGAVPYARYLVLVNHSYLHVFFTYRAQLATLLAAAMILSEATGWGSPATTVAPKRRAGGKRG